MDVLRGQLDEKRLAGAWGSSELDDDEVEEGLDASLSVMCFVIVRRMLPRISGTTVTNSLWEWYGHCCSMWRGADQVERCLRRCGWSLKEVCTHL